MNATAVKTEFLSDSCVRLTCTLTSPPERVYDAWTKAEMISRWFSPEPGTTCRIPRFDVRVGGSFQIEMTLRNQEVHAVVGEFEHLEPFTRVGFTWGSCTDHTEPSSHVTIDLTPQGTGTLLVLTDDRLPSRAAAESHAAGWDGCLTALIDFIASQEK